jgi:cytochrome bd-type quinol oxidase subunit 2
MKLADNTVSPSTGGTLATHTEQPVQKAEQEDLTLNFFVVGGVINIVMILAYFVWAFRQWKKIDRRRKSQ